MKRLVNSWIESLKTIKTDDAVSTEKLNAVIEEMKKIDARYKLVEEKSEPYTD